MAIKGQHCINVGILLKPRQIGLTAKRMNVCLPRVSLDPNVPVSHAKLGADNPILIDFFIGTKRNGRISQSAANG